MAIYGDDMHLFSLKAYLGCNLRDTNEIINDIILLLKKIKPTALNSQELSDDIQRLYEKEMSLKVELDAILSSLSKIICIGLQEKETYPSSLNNWGLNSSFIVRKKPDDDV